MFEIYAIVLGVNILTIRYRRGSTTEANYSFLRQQNLHLMKACVD
jgi:hypothetical protein